MTQILMIVESPSKAKTIQQYLGQGYKVLASYGHIRDLTPKKGAVIVSSKSIEMKYEVVKKNAEHLERLYKEALHSSEILLATDPDREGEAIAFHLAEIFKERGRLEKIPIQRVVFYEISKKSVAQALSMKRDLDFALINAQQARRALDYLVGFGLSPVLWKKVKPGLSAGRVQSPALRMISDREKEILDFQTREYWNIFAHLVSKKESFEAKLTHIQGKKVQQFDFANQKNVNECLEKIDFEAGQRWDVIDIQDKQRKRHPVAPFTTSTLQQEAARKLGFSSSHTMKVAQQLYEGIDIGTHIQALITYMRTDSVSLSQDAVTAVRSLIADSFGSEYLPLHPREYKTKSKNAQEAHEAVRPIDPSLEPDGVKAYLTADQYKLYRLIWSRTVSSQMSDALYEEQVIKILAGEHYHFETRRSLLKKEGFLVLYQEGQDDESQEILASKRLFKLEIGDRLVLNKWSPTQHFTEAPSRYNEASLVKALDSYGIGRPSTYASIISTLKNRGYVELRQKRFYPTDIGTTVSDFLKKFFSTYVDYSFTAQLEDQLDSVAAGELEWASLVHSFSEPFNHIILHVTEKISKKEAIAEEIGENCPECGHALLKKLGRSGRFIGCSNYPECRYARPLESADGSAPPALERSCPECQKPLIHRKGRYGLFIGCSGYPDCNYIESKQKAIETDITCPACLEGKIVGKKSKRGLIFFACNKYPTCKQLYSGEPIESPCQQCGYKLRIKKQLKRTGDWLVCPQKECGHKESLGFDYFEQQKSS